MKIIEEDRIDSLPGTALSATDEFSFNCHPGIGCFNQCCRNLNLFLYPYDVLRLRSQLGISSDLFIETYVDVVLREGNHFPDVLLTMREDASMSCPFLCDAGCAVYPDRPGTCRMFPMEHGRIVDGNGKTGQILYRFRPPGFCLGPREKKLLTVGEWITEQDAKTHNEMADHWADIKKLFISDPWGTEGPSGPKARMAFMATYNLDRFRFFVRNSTFLKRYKVSSGLVNKILKEDVALLEFGFEWVKLFVWGAKSAVIRPRK